MLKLDDLKCGYGGGEVIHGVSLTVDKGAVSVLGRNGAGKTTLLQAIMGFVAPTAGSITYDGQEIGRLAPEKIVRRGIAYVPQEGLVFARLTVAENLALARRLAGPTGRAVSEMYEMFPVLGKRGRQYAGSLSGGERKFLGLARALLYAPRLLILDEPTEGVWPSVVTEIGSVLNSLKSQTTLLIVEQNITMALGLSDYVYVLDRGEVLLEGPTDTVSTDPRLLAAVAA